MNVELPVFFALFGTALMTVAIYARPRPVRAPAVPALTTSPEPAPTAALDGIPRWPKLLDEMAPPCDTPTRRALVDALAALREPWALALLTAALDDENDPAIRDAIRMALDAGATGSLSK